MIKKTFPVDDSGNSNSEGEGTNSENVIDETDNGKKSARKTDYELSLKKINDNEILNESLNSRQ